MCCFKERKTPATCVFWLSFLVMACGIAMLVESIIWQYKESILTADLGDISANLNRFKTASFAILIAFSCTAILVGLSGTFCLCKPCH